MVTFGFQKCAILKISDGKRLKVMKRKQSVDLCYGFIDHFFENFPELYSSQVPDPD